MSNITMLTTILLITSSNFDSTEVKTILTFILGNGITEKIFHKS